MDELAVDLTDADDRQVRMEEMPSAPVLGDGVGSIADPTGEIEGRERAGADAAGASAETMDEAGDVPRGHHVGRGQLINRWRNWLGERHQMAVGAISSMMASAMDWVTIGKWFRRCSAQLASRTVPVYADALKSDVRRRLRIREPLHKADCVTLSENCCSEWAPVPGFSGFFASSE
jgi:hypothetical protein